MFHLRILGGQYASPAANTGISARIWENHMDYY